MKIGYLHLGTPQRKTSGVIRYGHILAAEAFSRSELEVIEANVTLTDNRQHNKTVLAEAAQQLSQAEVVHLQYNKYTWGGGWRQLEALKIFFRKCRRPCIVTVHDMYSSTYPRYRLGLLSALGHEYQIQQNYGDNLPKTFYRTVRSSWNDYQADRATLRWLALHAYKLLMCTAEELRRVNYLVNSQCVKIIPHFVETRSITSSPQQARAALALEPYKVVTLQGFIYSGKGHQLLVSALPKLPPEVKVVFAGGVAPNNEQFLQDLLQLAQSKGVENRLHVTGYLSDEDLERYLVATHLAVSPFKLLSASSSLSTWISVARPILASDLPQIAEYNQLEPGAIHTFSPYTAAELAAAIERLLPMCQDNEDPDVARLREKLALPKIFDAHLKVYQEAASVRLKG